MAGMQALARHLHLAGANANPSPLTVLAESSALANRHLNKAANLLAVHGSRVRKTVCNSNRELRCVPSLHVLNVCLSLTDIVWRDLPGVPACNWLLQEDANEGSGRDFVARRGRAGPDGICADSSVDLAGGAGHTSDDRVNRKQYLLDRRLKSYLGSKLNRHPHSGLMAAWNGHIEKAPAAISLAGRFGLFSAIA